MCRLRYGVAIAERVIRASTALPYVSYNVAGAFDERSSH
jgi:hypothetical protein